jgi:hypothetical protein
MISLTSYTQERVLQRVIHSTYYVPPSIQPVSLTVVVYVSYMDKIGHMLKMC